MESETLGDNQTFGALLRHFRETYAERIGRGGPGMPRFRLSALALIRCMAEHGVSISSGAYSEIEQSASLPREPEAFVRAAARCLDLSQADERLLAEQAAYDKVRSMMPGYIDQIMPKPRVPDWPKAKDDDPAPVNRANRQRVGA